MAAYLLAELDVHDPDGFAQYRDKVAPLVERFGGRYIVRGGKTTQIEGRLAAPRLVIIEFEDRAAALHFYRSADYQEILPLRLRSANGTVTIVEGI